MSVGWWWLCRSLHLLALPAVLLAASCTSQPVEVYGADIEFKGWFANGFPVLEADRVPAIIDAYFGIKYTIRGTPEHRLVPVTTIVRFPPGGIVLRGERRLVHKTTRREPIGELLQFAYAFDVDGEVVEGTWVLEVWYEGSLQAAETFEVYAPGEEEESDWYTRMENLGVVCTLRDKPCVPRNKWNEQRRLEAIGNHRMEVFKRQGQFH